jgi:hypothetical protein
MQAIWEVAFIGMSIVMIAVSVVAIVGLGVAVWWTRKID